MAPQVISIHEALQRLHANPAFDAGSAYVRTKLYCEAITLAGLKIPYWGAIREEIGKGSATDINRGIRDFRSEHAAKLATRPTVPPDVPESLAEPLLALWRVALAEAAATFDEERRSWLADIEQAEAAAQAATQARDDLQAALDIANHAVAQGREALGDARGQLTKAQSLAGDLQQQLAQQETALRRAADESRAEREAANQERAGILAREDEARRSFLLQIDKARSDAAARIAEVENQREKLQLDLQQARARTDTLLEDNRALAAQRDDLSRQLAVLAKQSAGPKAVPTARDRLQARKARRR